MRNFIKKITHPFLKFLFTNYYRKTRKYSYKGISVLVHPEVFPPHFTLSTKILLDYLNELDLKDKSLLELGCGSGIISLLSVSKGAKVTASDINPIAIEYLSKSAKNNKLELKVVVSNLFQDIENKDFDCIIINPPYYPKNADKMKDRAWFCGEDFNYFEELFIQLKSFIPASKVIMILSQDCEIETIKSIAKKSNLCFSMLQEKTVSFEKNFIFSINKMN